MTTMTCDDDDEMLGAPKVRVQVRRPSRAVVGLLLEAVEEGGERVELGELGVHLDEHLA